MHNIGKDRTVRIEPVDGRKPLVETTGYHKIPTSAIFRHRDNRDESVCIVLEDRIVAWGAGQPLMEINDTMKEIRAMSYLKRRMAVDSAFGRALKYMISHAGGTLLVLIGVGIMISMIMSGG